jgi:hypothetical protein
MNFVSRARHEQYLERPILRLIDETGSASDRKRQSAPAPSRTPPRPRSFSEMLESRDHGLSR